MGHSKLEGRRPVQHRTKWQEGANETLDLQQCVVKIWNGRERVRAMFLGQTAGSQAREEAGGNGETMGIMG